MVVTCPGCGSWFIVCAVHLEPDAQTVRCLKCSTRWQASEQGIPAPELQDTGPRPGTGSTDGIPANPPERNFLACEDSASRSALPETSESDVAPDSAKFFELAKPAPADIPKQHHSANDEVAAVCAQAIQAARAALPDAESAARKRGEIHPFRMILILLILIGAVTMLAQSKQQTDTQLPLLEPGIAADTAPVNAIPASPTEPGHSPGGHIF